jgi:hypothetical protein
MTDTSDILFANDEQIQKTGALGKFVAKNRRLATAFVIFVSAVGALVVCVMCGRIFVSMLIAIAQACGWTDTLSALRYYAGAIEHDTVRLPSGVLVERVIEPTGSISDNFSVFLLLWHIAETENKKLDRTAVKRGYAEWHVSDKQMHNFTFAAAKRVAVREVGADHCLCGLQLGLPYNIVFLRETGEMMFEPFVEHEGSATIELDESQRGRTFALIKQAEQHASRSNKRRDPLTLSAAASGIVQFTTETGALKRTTIYEAFVCVKQCIVLFDECASGVFSH